MTVVKIVFIIILINDICVQNMIDLSVYLFDHTTLMVHRRCFGQIYHVYAVSIVRQ